MVKGHICPVRSRLRFSTKNVPFVNGGDARPVHFSCEQRSAVGVSHGRVRILLVCPELCVLVLKVFNGMSLGELEAFVAEQENLASAANPEQEESPERGEVLDVRLGEKHVQEHGRSHAHPSTDSLL